MGEDQTVARADVELGRDEVRRVRIPAGAGVDDYGLGGVVMAGDGDVGGTRRAGSLRRVAANLQMTVVLRQLWVRSWRPSRLARLVNAWVAAPPQTVDGLIRVGDDDQRQADVVELVEDIHVGGGAVLRLVDHQFGA
jgi:hypothetical protein